MVDECGKRGGFTRSRATNKQDDATLGQGQLGQQLGQAKVFKRRNLGLDAPANHPNLPLLVKRADTESHVVAKSNCELALQRLIELPLLLLPMSSRERRRRIEVALRAVDLIDRADHYPRQLSGGQEQRVGIARAIVAHPKVVVADEPTGDLDPDTSNQILNLLKRLNKQLQVTLLMVTHDADAAGIADNQFRLDHGKLVQTGVSTDDSSPSYPAHNATG